MAVLFNPSNKYQKSFLEALTEYHREGRHLEYDIIKLKTDFNAFVNSLLGKSDENNLSPNMVAETVYWLIDEEEFIGRISIRPKLNECLAYVGGHIGYDIRPSKRKHGYGKIILRLGLEKARMLGCFEKVLLTCDEENIGSKKIIESNGGILKDKFSINNQLEKLRYWIYL